ncbi:MAG: histidine phosphatase family protein [Anaerolineae bacterium]|jgi:broad specificity phosphatase PhoE|nr:histidine phosphatase family protein [Anaerolineae bacterium]
MQLVYIRHAESHNNYMYYLNGSNEGRLVDPPLSELGEKQAVELANFLEEHKQEFNFDRIYISPFLRTLQTAAAFTHLYPDIPKTVWAPLHEGGGCFEIESEEPHVTVGNPGMSRSEIAAQFPEYAVSDEITEEGWYFLPEVEPHSHRFYRAYHVIEELVEKYGETDDRICLVSHGGFHNHLTNAIMSRTRQHNLWLEIDNTAMTEFGFKSDRISEYHKGWWRIEYMNRHEWLHGKDLKRDWSIYS